MTQKKQKQKRRPAYNRTIVISSCILILGIVLFGLMFRDATPRTHLQSQAQRSSDDGGTLSLGLDTPAVAEAKMKADIYFESLRNCELEAANSYRVLPKTKVSSREECLKECPGGITYAFIKPVSYKKSESTGITTELSLLEYSFTCGDNNYPTIIQMIRHSDTNVWQVLNMS